MEMEDEINLDAEEDTDEEDNEMEASGDGSQLNNHGEEATQFDITVSATHSYMGPELAPVSGRNLLEAGWEGHVPALVHHGCVFPGETVPLLLTHHDAVVMAQAIDNDNLFALLYPDETGREMSGYGVVCEVFEAGAMPGGLQCKARALARVRSPVRALLECSARIGVRVLPELAPPHPLQRARLAALAPSVPPRPGARHLAALRRLEAAGSPWPRFVFDMFNYSRMRVRLLDYFRSVGLAETLVPEEPVALSLWTAANLPAAERDRRALFQVDSALLRLHMECAIIARKSALCCAMCGAKLAQRDHVFAMSSDGLHTSYTNPSGYVHDVVTVSVASGAVARGARSAKYSWFPGYAWRIALCASCGAHVGWRFTATRPLRPAAFYGLCRNYVTAGPTMEGDLIL